MVTVPQAAGGGGDGDGGAAGDVAAETAPPQRQHQEHEQDQEQQHEQHSAATALSGKQEHYLKRELVSEQVRWEISELNSPTALRRFGAPFKSDFGEVSPLESELPILRYIFVHHVRDFPFLDKAREKEFWQDKLQVFLESFASKSISSSEDRLEETKRRKLANKCQKLVELMVVSGVKTSSGFEERVRFSEIELVDSNAIDTGVMHTVPEGNLINGWDVNVAAVRITYARRNIRQHKHAEFILRVKRNGGDEFFVSRRYADFAKLHKEIRLELPGKVVPSLPRKNKSDSTAPSLFSSSTGDDDDASSVSSSSTQHTALSQSGDVSLSPRSDHRKSNSASAAMSPSSSARPSPRMPSSPQFGTFRDAAKLSPAMAQGRFEKTKPEVLGRETQRISLRSFVRTLLHNPQIAQTQAVYEFLTKDPIAPNDADREDMAKRRFVDQRRVEEQKEFYEVARKRAADLDVYMEQFRRDIVEKNGLTKLFSEIKEKNTIPELSIQYRKFAEWLRIEVAATIYHLFIAEDNSPEMFAQAKRIHSLIPYTVIKNVIRIANPAAVMSGILDVFLAQPFGTRSLMQRIFSLTLNDGIRTLDKSIDALRDKIGDPVFSNKLKQYTESEDHVKLAIRDEAKADDLDLVVAILKSDLISPSLSGPQFEQVFNAYVAFNNAVDNVDAQLKEGAQLFSYMKQLLKLCTRQRDKLMMLNLIEEPVTLQLFRDLFTIFYEPLVRVYKSANVYGSVTDFSAFIDDMIQVVTKCRDDDFSADPNQTVQAFIDLCARHEHNFYKFVHEVHTHDNGLFTQLMGWIEGILGFLRNGPANGTLNVNALFEGGVSTGVIDKHKTIAEIDQLIAWQEARKRWHHNKTRQKMAAEGHGGDAMLGMPTGAAFTSEDFGLDYNDIEDMGFAGGDSDDSEEEDLVREDDMDPVEAERRHRAKKQDRLRRSAGEPVKPAVEEVHKLRTQFLVMLREVLAQ